MNKSLGKLTLALLVALSSCVQVVTEIEANVKNAQGVEELNAGKYENAVASFKEAIKSPNLSKETRAQIYRNIAQAFIDMEQFDSSIQYSTLAANCYDKNSYEYLVNIADVEIMTGKTSNALVRLQKAQRIKPDEVAANNTLGLIYLGDYGEEFIDLEKALVYNTNAFRINDDRTTEYVLARNYYDLMQFKNSEKHYENLYKKYPDNVLHPLSLGMVKYKLNKKDEAKILWKEVEKLDTSYNSFIQEFIVENEQK